MNNKKVIFETQETDFDASTGEINRISSTKVIKLPSEPPYVKMYIHDLSQMLNIPKAEEELLRMLLMKLDYEGYMSISKRFRERLCEKLGIKDQVLRNKLTKLVKAGAIINTSYGEYMANPEYFARGQWQDICENKKVFEMKIRYSEKGREIITEAVEEQTEMDI